MNWKVFKSFNALIVSFVLAGFLIGLLVVAQFQSSVAANSFLVDELNAQKNLLASFDKDRVNLKARISNLRARIEDKQAKLSQVEDQAKLEKLDALKKELGLTKVRGAGVKIFLSEGEDKGQESNAHLIHAADLRDLVNLLRTAKVEGISINDQRITPNAVITALGSEILINKIKVAPPYEINIIGDIELIANRLSDKQSYPDVYARIYNKSIGFELEQLSQLLLPVYDGDYLLKYARYE
jgi:uncharacterized protein YlxW (UPF0749 family)